MKHLIIGILIFWLLLGCAPKPKGVYVFKTVISNQVVMVGHTTAQVKEALGEPDTVKAYNKPADSYSMAGSWTAWIYGPIYVLFDEEGIVRRIIE